jgi:hypothetical protein
MKKWKKKLVGDGVFLDLVDLQNLMVSLFERRSNG